MSAEDYMPDDLGIEFWSSHPGYSYRGYAHRMPQCFRCMKKDLSWGVSDGKWRLFENAVLHRCHASTDARNDFTATKEQP